MRRTIFLAGVFFLSSCVSLHASPTDGAAAGQKRILALLDGAENMTLSPESYDASGLELRSGHLGIRWDGGRLRYIYWGTERMGVFLSGRGKAVYTSEDNLDAEILKRNTQSLFLWKDAIPKDSTARVEFKIDRCMILANEKALQSMLGENLHKVAGQKSDTHELGGLQRVTKAIIGYNAPMALAYVASNGISQPYAVTLLEGRSRVLHAYDPVLSHEENLYLLRKEVGPGTTFGRIYTFLKPLSNQKIGHSRSEIIPFPVALTAVAHDLNYEKGRAFTLKTKIELVTTEPDQKTLLLNLWNARNPDNPFWNAKKRKVIVKKLADEGGNDVPFIHRYNRLLVFLNGPVPKEARVTLTAELEENILGSDWWSGNEQFLLVDGAWFPRPPMTSKVYDYSIEVRAKKPYRPILAGSGIVTETPDGFYVSEVSQRTALTAPPILCGKYSGETIEANGVTIRLWEYGNYLRNTEYNDRVRDAVDFYSRRFVPYPFHELDIVYTDAFGKSESFPGLAIMQRTGGWDSEVIRRPYRGGGYTSIAAQWWGVLVRPPSTEERWLYDSLATYSDFLFYKGRPKEKRWARDMYDGWKLMCEWSEGAGSIYMADHLRKRGRRGGNRYLKYGRGPMMIHAIAREIGEDNLIRAMSLFVQRHAMGFAGSQDFLDVLNEVSGRDISGFFERWLYGTTTPDIPPFELKEKVSRKFR